MKAQDTLRKWTAPDSFLKIETLEVHTGGEPLRIITSGYPDLVGETILERRDYALNNLDHLRKALLGEPRGHNDMYGALITEAVTPVAKFGVLFMHNEGYSTMCGHGIIGLAMAAAKTGLVTVGSGTTDIGIDTPAGLVTAHVRLDDHGETFCSFENVPSYVQALDLEVDVLGIGPITYDLAFGGAFYAYVDVAQVGLALTATDYDALIDTGMKIKQAVMESQALTHPDEADLNFLYGVIFVGPPENEANHSRNVCIFADGQIDRSPTGTGVSGRVAIHHARGEIGLDMPIVIESIIGSTFTVTALREETFGSFDAVVPLVEGTAYITGKHTFLIDPADQLGGGFMFNKRIA